MLTFRFLRRPLKASNASEKNLRMTCCDEHATIKTSKLGTQFFAHKRRGECTSAAETAEHLFVKACIAKAIRGTGWEVDQGAAWPSARRKRVGSRCDGQPWGPPDTRRPARAWPPVRRAAPGRRGRGAEIAPAHRAAGPRDRGHLARPAVDRRRLGPGQPGLWRRGQAGDAATRRLPGRTGAGRAARAARDPGAQPAGR